MNKIDPFNVTYDALSDVLYISRDNEVATRGIEDKTGIVWRYNKAGVLIGATIVDFVDILLHRQAVLADEISTRFNVPSRVATTVVESAMGRRDN